MPGCKLWRKGQEHDTPAAVIEDISEDILLAADTARICNHLVREEIVETGEIVLSLLLDTLEYEAQSPAQ